MKGAFVDSALVAGVDIGGTAMKIGLVSQSGEVRSFRSVPTPHESGDAVLERIVETVEDLCGKQGLAARDLAAAGVGAPSLVDRERGMARNPPNLPAIDGYPLRDRLADRLGVPVHMDNDASAFAQAEACFGYGRGCRNIVCLTLGTGVGGGAIVDGHVLRGLDNAGTEFGHMVINFEGPACGCGARGCVEAYASKKAIIRRAREFAKRGLAPVLARLMEAGEDLSPELVHRAALEGDAGAARVLFDTGRYLGECIGSLVCALSPEVIVLGGGIAAAETYLRPGIEEAVQLRIFPVHRQHLAIRFTELGPQAGMLGAVAVALFGTGLYEWEAGRASHPNVIG